MSRPVPAPQPADATEPDAATAAQNRAADPARSTWLSANAGSGKTRVLINRVARLLLAGTPPQNILCLTFTKAAAGEMQNRLFATLGGWALRPDAALAADLRRIGVDGTVTTGALAEARRLFARAIETPGGLKIQTIHAFCASILRQFPLEAGISPGFRDIDEREARLLRMQVFDRLAEGPQGRLVAEFSRLCRPDELDGALEELAANKDALAAPRPEPELRRWFGLGERDDADSVRAAVVDADIRSVAAVLATALAGGTEAQRRDAAQLGRLTELSDLEAALVLDSLLLNTTSDSAKDRLCKAVAKLAPALADDFDALVARLLDARDRLRGLDALQQTLALQRFGAAYVRAYHAAKAARGLLDFDDLIGVTQRLLSRAEMAQWVLYRLDGRIDHILVDEAQDTSPAQWRIIAALAQEFGAGEGARDTLRTLFAVGDRKQSIYSFQGADPREFDHMAAHFAARLAATGPGLQQSELHHSFRAAPLLLALVDRVFAQPGRLGTGAAAEHVAFHPALPGRLDLWPLITTEKDEPAAWHDTRPRTSSRAGALVLAERLADEIRRMLAEDRIPDGNGNWRRLTAGDILVLVRRRSFISDPLMLALKQRGVAVAGSDQIELASELAVRDVIAVLKVLVTPADSLSLAAALRSPIFGLSEAELYALAQGRPQGQELWQALEAAAARHPQAAALLTDLRQQADFLRPFELIERLLIRHDARRKLRARLGDEIDEALDVLLQQAMAYEAGDVPSLTGFLAWHEAEAMAVKRQAELAGGRLRVMTVHGAKGLEAPVVILPDTADHKPKEGRRLILDHDGQPLPRIAQPQRPRALQALHDVEAQARREEDARLLYVALTRPRYWLIVCGAGEDAAAEPCWHRQVRDAMAAFDSTDISVTGKQVSRLQAGAWPAAAADDVAAAARAAPQLPAWALTSAEPGPPLLRLLAPSRLGAGLLARASGSAAETDREEALRHGSEVHLLLEHLPRHARAAWPEVARAVLSAGDSFASDDAIAERLEEATTLLDAPHLQWLWQAETLAEVDLTAALPGMTAGEGDRLLGRIDLLVREPGGGLLAVDYKSNAQVPISPEATPSEILLQLGAYRMALRQIFPDTPVTVAVLWTRAATLMRIPEAVATDAMTRAGRSDAAASPA